MPTPPEARHRPLTVLHLFPRLSRFYTFNICWLVHSGYECRILPLVIFFFLPSCVSVGLLFVRLGSGRDRGLLGFTPA